MGLHGVRPVEIGPGACAACDGFVILVAVIAEGEIVHGALGGGHRAEGAEKCIRHGLARLDIAADHRGGEGGREHRAFGNDDLDRLEAAFIERDIVIHHAAEDIKHGGARDGGRRVEIACECRTRAREVDQRAARAAVHFHGDADFRAVVHRQFEARILQPGDDAADIFFGIVLHMGHVGLDHIEAEFGDHAAKLLRALFAGGNLRPKIGNVLFRVAGGVSRLSQQRAHLGFAEAAALDDAEVVDQHAFFLDIL